MRNIMIVDGAVNCAYDIFQVRDNTFIRIFPEPGQNIAFSEDIFSKTDRSLSKELWQRPIKKEDANGIHGIIFFNLAHKKKFYPTLRDRDLDQGGRAKPLYGDEM